MNIIDDRIRHLVRLIDCAPACTNEMDSIVRELIARLQTHCERPDVVARYEAYRAAKGELQAYPLDEHGFAVSFDVLMQEEAFMDAWNRYGVVVSKGVISVKQRQRVIGRMHELVRSISEGHCDLLKPETWGNIPVDKDGVSLVSRGFFEVYHDDPIAALRQAVRVYLHYVLIWGTPDLWTTFDRLGVKLPGHEESKALPLHVDQNPNVHDNFRTVQGVLAISDCPAERGTFVGVPGSKLHFHEYGAMAKNSGEYVELDMTTAIARKLDAHKQAFPLRGGDLVSWDSRTTHANSENISDKTRMVAYIAAGPARNDDADAANARDEGYRTGVGKNVRGAMMHASKPPRYTSPATLAGAREPEELTLLGKVVYGQTVPFSKQRLLLNAEAFGFGPTAAIADFFLHLRKGFETIGYVGTGHTLDLQRELPYDFIHDITGLEGEEREKALEEIFSQYDIMLTALDFEMAVLAQKQGLPVCIYDPLTWYWRKIPPVVGDCSLYIAQDFYGVKERLASEAASFAAPHVVPAIIPASMPWHGKRSHILLNLGGLSNPFWNPADTLAYARLVTSAFCSAVAQAKETVIIAGNTTLERELAEFGVKNYTREEMRGILHKAKFAFMTPGLGNIYDAARYMTPTIWLPPANDSQGQQRDLIVANKMADGALDWADFVEGANIDYSGADQQLILKQISEAVAKASSDAELQKQMTALMRKLIRRVRRKTVGASTALVHEFGWGGAKEVADAVLEQAQKEKRNARLHNRPRRGSDLQG